MDILGLCLFWLLSFGAQNVRAVQPQGGRNASALKLEIEALGERYCAGDDEGGTLQIRSVLRFTNVSKEPLILYKSSGELLQTLAASTLDDLRAGRFELEGSFTNYTQGEPGISELLRPGRSFVILPPGGSFQSKDVIPIMFKRQPASKLAGLNPGRYLVQVVVGTWPESQDLGKALHEQWRKWGNLWFQPSITSLPFTVTVKREPKIESCE